MQKMNDLPFTPKYPETQLAVDAALKASDAILEVYNTDFDVQMKGHDNPVTEADLRSDKIIQEILSKSGYPILSEEDDDNHERLQAKRIWIIDPLDGTKEFTLHQEEFVIMIALVEDHKPIIGLVYQPTTKSLFVAEVGTGTYQRIEGQWSKITANNDHGMRAIVSKNHLGDAEKSFLEKLGVNDFFQKGSAGLKIAALSSGEADFYFTTNKIKHWDTAPGYCLISEAGGRMTDLLGNEILFNTEVIKHENGVLVSNGKIHDMIVEKYKEFVKR